MAHYIKALLKLSLNLGFIMFVSGCAVNHTAGNYDPQERSRIFKAECISQQKSIQSNNVVFHEIEENSDKKNSKYEEDIIAAHDVFGPSDIDRVHCGG